MVTPGELFRVLLMPLIVSAIIAFLARWRRWAWLTPVAVGAAFLTGYALIGVPKLPPSDGSDWLFWIAMPLTIVGVVAALLPCRWAIGFAVAAGLVALVIILPLTPASISIATAVWTVILLGAAGIVVVTALLFAESRLGASAVLIVVWLTLSAAAVMVMSSNFRVGGLYGIAAAAAVAGLIPARINSVRGPIVIAISLLTGLLTCGHFYPDPGVTWAHFAVLLASPLLLAMAAVVPVKRTWIRSAIGIAAVAAAVACVTVPTALAAKHAAEDDPYGSTN